jgi:hypothetical protein
LRLLPLYSFLHSWVYASLEYVSSFSQSLWINPMPGASSDVSTFIPSLKWWRNFLPYPFISSPS